MNIINEMNNDLLIDKLFENIKISELKLYLSNNLRYRLKKIKHIISKTLLDISEDNDKKFKFSYVDETEKEDMVSFIMVNKIPKDENGNLINYGLYDNTTRTELKIGKLITKIFGDKFPVNKRKDSTETEINDIESFVNMYKSTFNKFDEFEIVKGEDIRFYYNSDNYVDNVSGRLGSSCMRYSNCESYFDIYCDNDNVSMIILRDKEEEIVNSEEKFGEIKYKIKGRAILWKLSRIDHKSVEDRYYMDRIYTHNDSDQYLFIDYAKENKWLYKGTQSYGREYSIVDPIDDTKEYRFLEVDVNKSSYKHYPYVDTLSHFNNSILDNDKDPSEGLILTDTEGNYEDLEANTVYSEYMGEEIEESDARWCEYDRDYCREDDAIYLDSHHCYCTPATDVFEYHNRMYPEDDGVYDDYNGEMIPSDDSVYCEEEGENIHSDDAIELDYRDGYFTPNADFETDSVNNRQLYHKDAVFSKTQDSYIVEDESVEVIINEDGDTDWIYSNEEDKLFKQVDGEYYLISYLEEKEEKEKYDDTEKEEIKTENVKNDIFLKIYKFNEFNKKYII